MFSSISWQEYWTLLVVITLAYYLVIYFLNFKNGALLSSKKGVLHSETTVRQELQPDLFQPGDPAMRQPAKDTEEHIIHPCMDELNAFFDNQKKIKVVKTELMFGLYTILQKYPSLRNSDYKESLTNVIATQCENICSIHLSAEELKGVWFG